MLCMKTVCLKKVKRAMETTWKKIKKKKLIQMQVAQCPLRPLERCLRVALVARRGFKLGRRIMGRRMAGKMMSSASSEAPEGVDVEILTPCMEKIRYKRATTRNGATINSLMGEVESDGVQEVLFALVLELLFLGHFCRKCFASHFSRNILVQYFNKL